MSEKADKTNAETTDTGERKRRRRKGGGLRIPSDNVPRRASAPPVDSDSAEVQTNPDGDPKAAMSVVFGGDAEPAPMSVPAVDMPAVEMEALAPEETGGDSVDIPFDDEAEADADPDNEETNVQMPAPPRIPPPRAATQALTDEDWEEVMEEELPSASVLTSADVSTGGPRGKGKADVFDDRKTIPMPVVTPEQIEALTGEKPDPELIAAGTQEEAAAPTAAAAEPSAPIAASPAPSAPTATPPAPSAPIATPPTPSAPAAAAVPVADDAAQTSGPTESEIEAGEMAEPDEVTRPGHGPATPPAPTGAAPVVPVEIPQPPTPPVPSAESTASVETSEAEAEAEPAVAEPASAEAPSDGTPSTVEPYDAGDSGEVITDDLIEEVSDGADVVVDASAPDTDAAEEPAAPPPTPPAPPPPKAPPAPPKAASQKAPKPPPKSNRRRPAKPWYDEIFEEDYLRTLPFLTPQATQQEALFVLDSLELDPGAQVLDVGCGYGRHAMELAARGYHVVALDASLPLLLRGADEAQRRGLDINFVHGDMRELNFDAQFDGAYCLFSTFGYFDDELNKKAAQGIARSLKPGARLVVQVLNRDYIIGDLPSRVWWEGDGCVVLEEVEFNYFSSRIHSNRSVVFDDGRQLEQEISLRAYSLHEFGKLLHACGFRVLEVSGSLVTKGRFFGNKSRDIIVVAERRGPSGETKVE